jgi:AraC-like DNA-binding protein
MSQIPTVFAKSARKIVEAVRPLEKTDHLLRTIGLDRDAVADESLRIPYADLMMLAAYAADQTKDPAFGLRVGTTVDLREYGVIGASILSSSTLRDALQAQARYLPIWTTVGSFRLQEEGEAAQISWEFAKTPLPDARQDCEMTMATVAKFIGSSTFARVELREVWFEHAKPRDASEHTRVFGVPVHFRMPTNALLFDRDYLDIPLKSANPESHALSTAAGDKLLARTNETLSFSQCVLSFIRLELENGTIDLESAARRLGVSRRTLQRKLKGEDCTYRDLVQQARQDLSQYLLCGNPRTATETAYALGYSEPSAFQHAFRKWHGMPAGEFKREVNCLPQDA